jgi:hypothetical protein
MRLSVPEPACVRHLPGLLEAMPASRHSHVLDLLAASPDPSAAILALPPLLTAARGVHDLSDEALTVFVVLASQSRFLGRYLARTPAALQALSRSGALAEGKSHAELLAAAMACAASDPAGLFGRKRRRRSPNACASCATELARISTAKCKARPKSMSPALRFPIWPAPSFMPPTNGPKRRPAPKCLAIHRHPPFGCP